MGIGDWGLGIGDWGLGIGDWYKFVYSPFKMVNGIKKEIKKDDLLEEDDIDIVGNFEFQRKEHFS